MALTTVTKSSSTPTAPKGIAVMVQGSSANILYTVPTGRRFKGHMWTNQQDYYGTINGANMHTTYGSSYYSKRPLPIELAAGDVVKASPQNSDYTMLQGIEFDA